MKKLIVFDWNGTLLSDTRACMTVDNAILKAFGGRPVTIQSYRNTIIFPPLNFYTRHGCDEKEIIKNYKKLLQIFHTAYEPRASKSPLRAGARSLLKWLSDNKINVIILSNHTISSITDQLKRLGVLPYIADVLANKKLANALERRNKKEKLQEYLKEHRYTKHDVLIVGDSPEEVEIGRALGIKSAAISNGYYATARLKKAKPDYLIYGLAELKKIIR